MKNMDVLLSAVQIDAQLSLAFRTLNAKLDGLDGEERIRQEGMLAGLQAARRTVRMTVGGFERLNDIKYQLDRDFEKALDYDPAWKPKEPACSE